jgi:uncharacterized Zn-finger protein
LLLLAVLLYCRIPFFSLTAFGLSKICLVVVVAKHILVLPITLCLGPLVEVLGCNGLGFDDNGHLVDYKPKNMRNMGPNVPGHHPSFFLEKEESTQYFCTACNNNYVHK